MPSDLTDQDTDHQNGLDWRGAIPIARRFDDPYFSLENGLAETEHVFLHGNDLPTRFEDGFCVAELGFGTGLNLLTTLKAWRETGISGTLRYTSFEAFPMAGKDMQTALSAFPTLAPLVEELTHHLGARSFATEDLIFEMITGDARDTLPNWEGAAHAWYLDGFSPAKNPELWGEALMQSVADHTQPDGTFATYTAAGHVRRGLSQAGFRVERVPGYGRKRHMTKGTLL